MDPYAPGRESARCRSRNVNAVLCDSGWALGSGQPDSYGRVGDGVMLKQKRFAGCGWVVGPEGLSAVVEKVASDCDGQSHGSSVIASIDVYACRGVGSPDSCELVELTCGLCLFKVYAHRKGAVRHVGDQVVSEVK